MSSGNVDLDIILNYKGNKASMSKALNELKKEYTTSFEKEGLYNDPIKRRIMAEKEAIKDISGKVKEIVSSYTKLNRQGQLSYLFETGRFTRRRKDQKALGKKQFQEFLAEKIPEEFELEEERKKSSKAKKDKERKNEEEKAKNIAFERKLAIKRSIQHSKALEDNKKKDEDLRKKQWMLLLGKWGKLGVWGIIASQAIKYISKAIGYAYTTSMQGLDWERTIRGGAVGGSWFGQGLASYQRAGIGANQYQGFKRGIQGYLGQVKLGMGNAAPLMYLGLSALGNPDELEKQLEHNLRRLPKDVSLALAGQMGLDYNMWEAIYSGRLDREKSAYSEEAIKQWANLADSLNDLITGLKVLFFNNLAPIAEFMSRFLDKVVNKRSEFEQTANATQWWLMPHLALGRTLGQMVRFGAVEVIVKNQNGEVIDTKETNAMFELG